MISIIDSRDAQDDPADDGTAVQSGALRAHPLRQPLINEIHTRPFTPASSPALVSHMAFLTPGDNGDLACDHLGRLCERFNIAPPQPGVQHYSGNCGPFHVKWERHTEFASYTFMRAGEFEHPFNDPALALVPEDWLTGIPGELMVGAHVAITREHYPPETLSRLFNHNTIVGNRIGGDVAEAWTDFRLHGDGFGRILMIDRDVPPNQGGRLLQRLLEIETYRTMALLSLPLAKEIAPKVSVLDKQLADITSAMADAGTGREETDLLHDLTALAADVEQLVATSSYRFAASRAYYRIVSQRFVELRETRISSYPLMREFLQRRLSPAMETCESMSNWLQTLSNRISRASHLLRTRVDLELEAQNTHLLESMDRNARMQLQLQQTVEGLSTAAISYYLLGLVAIGFKALKGAGLPLNVEIATGLALPLVVFTVWRAIRRIRHRMHGE